MHSKKMPKSIRRPASTRVAPARDRLKRPSSPIAEAGIGGLSTSGFLADINHEIRTPMNGVIGMLALLLDSRLTPEQHEFAVAAHASAENLLVLINNVLDLSMIEVGAIDRQQAPFELAHELDAVFAALGVAAQLKGIKLMVRHSDISPALMMGDSARIRQVTANLVNHAIRFATHGQVQVDVATTATPGGCRLRVSVTNSSPILADKFSTTIDQFNQAVAPDIRKFDSTELGLALSKRLVELMGGEIGIDLQSEDGSTFWFSLDLAHAPNPLADVRILFFDDHSDPANTLQAQLAEYRMRGDSFSTAAEALSAFARAAAEKDPYRIAIIDAHMRGIDGELFGAAIKADPAYRDTLLVMSSSAGEQEAPRFANAGFSAFLSQPVNPQTLSNTLTTLCSALQRNKPTQFLYNGIAAGRDEHAQPFAGCRILLAEDDIINQRVASHMLEKLGCKVDIAPNGEQAAAMHHATPYDLVLMDCQMPEMDGYQATGRIRAGEAGQKHTPIVAWTAYSTQAEELKCLAAGMDAFLTKPMRPAALRDVLARWLRPPAAGVQSAASVPESSDNLEAMQEMFSDDFADLVALFRADSPKRIVALHVAVAEDDAVQTAKIAHVLSGSTASIGATSLAALCKELELHAKQGVLENMESRLAAIEHEYAKIDTKLRSMLASSGNSIK